MKVKFENEMYPAGYEFDFGGVLLVNMEDTEVTDEQLKAYEARHGHPFSEDVNKVSFVKVNKRSSKGGDD